MNLNYNEVPNMISGKDLDYLSDMFNWNCSAYKKTQNCIQQIQDEDIKSMIEKASLTFKENTTIILNILQGGNLSE